MNAPLSRVIIQAAKKSIELTHQWLERGFTHFQQTEPLYGYEQSFFPIVQGSVYKDLREVSATEICSYPADGYAIGGLSVGEPEEVMYEMVDVVTGILPDDKPRYLMGVGTPVNLLEAIAMGIDMFDCVMPTRNGRNGMLFTRKGIMNMRNNKWKDDFSALDPDGTCFVDQQYSKAYLRHLIISKEILGAQIASLHNLSFYLWLMEEARKKIREGTFGDWKKEMVQQLVRKIMKKPELYILDWYIIRKFLGTFFFTIALIVAIAVVFDLSEKIDDFLENNAPFKKIIFEYYLNFIPYFAVLFSPLFTFISVIYFTSRMAYNTEIIAILSSGVSFNRLAGPLFHFRLCAYGLCFYAQQFCHSPCQCPKTGV